MKSRLIINAILIYILTGCLTACSPGLGTNINVEIVNESEVKSLHDSITPGETRANVLQFQDQRTIETVAQIDGRLVKTDSDVGVITQKSFERYLRASGVKLSLFNSPSIRGAVKEWRVFVTPGFPATSAEATATIEVELIDAQGQIVHKSLYTGNYEESHPFMSEKKVKEALGNAMGHAINTALSDPQFINNLTAIQSARENVL